MKDNLAYITPENKAKHNTQNTTPDSGVFCLCSLLSYHGISADARQILHEYADNSGRLNLTGLIRVARKKGLKAKAVHTSVERLENHPLPAIAIDADGQFFIIARCNNARVLIQKAAEAPREISVEELIANWSGQLILLTRRAGTVSSEFKFGLRWFLPVMAKYKQLFSEIFFASLFLQSFGLITPLFFQVIIDKVLVHRGLTTLDVLIIGLVGITLFEALLGFLRTYMFSHTTSRVDVQLGSQLFRHLLALPVSYFESRPTGQTVARVRELDTVREFITSSSLTVVIDLLFSVIFFSVMWLFSPALTLIVLASIPAYLLVSLLITPALRKR